MTPLIINFTPTGMIPTRAMTSRVPLSIEEIVEDVHNAVDIGITMVHLHARDEFTYKPDYHAEIYSQIISRIRKFAPELIICVSTSGRTSGEFTQRAQVLALEGNEKPDMASLTLSSVNFNKQASVNSPDMIQALAKTMQKAGILPELEAFDCGMINYAAYLIKKGLLTPPHYFNLLLGNIACAQADLLHLGVMIKDLPDHSYWSVAGIGDAQLAMNTVSIAMGGGVRVGLEDNIWYDCKRTTLATNTDLLERIHRITGAFERPLMSSAELRRHLDLLPGHGAYGRSTYPLEEQTCDQV